jgi:hypothetical protein
MLRSCRDSSQSSTITGQKTAAWLPARAHHTAGDPHDKRCRHVCSGQHHIVQRGSRKQAGSKPGPDDKCLRQVYGGQHVQGESRQEARLTAVAGYRQEGLQLLHFLKSTGCGCTCGCGNGTSCGFQLRSSGSPPAAASCTRLISRATALASGIVKKVTGDWKLPLKAFVCRAAAAAAAAAAKQC